MVGVFAVQGATLRQKFVGLVGLVGLMVAGGFACEARVLDVSGEGGAGEACDAGCQDRLVCAPRVEAAASPVCAAPIEVRGRVIDAVTRAPIAGARVHGDDTVAVSDAQGRYVLALATRREEDGAPVAGSAISLQAFAADYRSFPAGLQVALPIALDAAYDADAMAYVIADEASTIGMLAVEEEQRGGVTISGRVGGDEPGGTLVLAEGSVPVFGVADREGEYVLFNVHGDVTVRGYRGGVEYVPRDVAVEDEDVTGVDLEVGGSPGRVRGAVNIVDPGEGTSTSVVLVPTRLYDEGLARGPVPFGLRVAGVTGKFEMTGVPTGEYRVLVGVENDFLVRDPDVSIGGTVVPEVDVKAGMVVDAGAMAFKVTGALAVVEPGREGPEVVGDAPVFVFASDPGAEHYVVRVFDESGLLVWETDAPKASGSGPISVAYAGPVLMRGGYYQFRAVSLKDKEGKVALSTTEELRGVFVVE